MVSLRRMFKQVRPPLISWGVHTYLCTCACACACVFASAYVCACGWVCVHVCVCICCDIVLVFQSHLASADYPIHTFCPCERVIDLSRGLSFLPPKRVPPVITCALNVHRHGVGCFLNVHEGPHGISPRPNTNKLMAGAIVSNEPGYYEDGEFGIRIENLCYFKEVPRPSPVWCFEF